MNHKDMFFIAEPDINFRIKGSRDPLGFQPIWQKLGRKVIKDLSTVQGNIRDFQLMSFAWCFWEDRRDKNFMAFFYKFEQACAYAIDYQKRPMAKFLKDIAEEVGLIK